MLTVCGCVTAVLFHFSVMSSIWRHVGCFREHSSSQNLHEYANSYTVGAVDYHQVQGTIIAQVQLCLKTRCFQLLRLSIG